jgi:spermidine synthase
MVFELLLLFGFQIVYGYVFHEIGILISAFMAGLAGGAILTASWPRKDRTNLSVFLKTEFAIIVLAFVFFAFIRFLEKGAHPDPSLVRIAFLVLLLASGFLAGMEFPIANRLYSRQVNSFTFSGDSTGKTVGLLYCVDLMGGWVGGVIGGFLIIPTLGIGRVCLVLAMAKATSFLLLLTLPRK